MIWYQQIVEDLYFGQTGAGFGMRILALVLFCLTVLLGAGTAAAGEGSTAGACPVAEQPLNLKFEEANTWTACEKWVWSCIVQGREANLFVRKCVEPRGRENDILRKEWLDTIFEDPSQFSTLNALSGRFLLKILWLPFYADQIPPPGIRIFGGYFAEHVNLENVSTSKNLVLDGSIFLNGLRLSNFHTERNLSLDGSNVHSRLILLRARVDGSLFLNRATFDLVDLRDARIGASIEATRSIFNDELRLDRARVEGKVYLIKSRITYLYAWDAYIGGSLELRLADVRLGMDLTGLTVNGDVRMQRLSFGEETADRDASCVWNRQQLSDDLLGDLLEKHKDSGPVLQKALFEVVGSRPAVTKHLCENGKIVGDATRTDDIKPKDMLLRDMKVKGTLCLYDISGEIAPAKELSSGVPQTPGTGSFIRMISLDGTQANSTVLKWKESPSLTLWRAVNFKTSYMLINLDRQPARHYIDNIDIGLIGFFALNGASKPRANDNGDDDKFLCDVGPADPDTAAMLNSSYEAHKRIVRFFTGPANQSRSAQPFSKIVERLEESGASSTYLKTKLSAYRLGKVCTTSAFSKAWLETSERPWRSFWQRGSDTYEQALKTGEIRDPRNHPGDMFVESNRLLWDGVCQAGMMTFAQTVSYGHEPYNLFLYIVFFVGLFWALLQFDRGSPSGEPPRQLGLIYAVDTFNPLPQMKLDRHSSKHVPNSRALRAYLKFHRFVGVVFAVLVFLFIYRAAK